MVMHVHGSVDTAQCPSSAALVEAEARLGFDSPLCGDNAVKHGKIEFVCKRPALSFA